MSVSEASTPWVTDVLNAALTAEMPVFDITGALWRDLSVIILFTLLVLVILRQIRREVRLRARIAEITPVQLTRDEQIETYHRRI
ncbi:MAG: hypothetical protein AAGI50_10255 [Pseudomonadota bacterium]